MNSCKDCKRPINDLEVRCTYCESRNHKQSVEKDMRQAMRDMRQGKAKDYPPMLAPGEKAGSWWDSEAQEMRHAPCTLHLQQGKWLVRDEHGKTLEAATNTLNYLGFLSCAGALDRLKSFGYAPTPIDDLQRQLLA